MSDQLHPLMDKYKLGKNEHVEDTSDLMLATYLDTSQLPPLPEGDFTIADLVAPEEWGMLLNNKLGCCAPAGIEHAQEAMARVGDHKPMFNDSTTEVAYEAMGGWDPANPTTTDQGCDLRTCAKVWQKQGIPDGVGGRHHCGVYLWLEPGNVQEQWYATYVLKNAINGYDLPANWMEAFDEEDFVWDFDPASKSLGGHCVPAFGKAKDGTDDVSWGHRLVITGAGIENKMDEGFTVVSSSILKAGAAQALDHEKLLHDIEALGLVFHDGVSA